MFETVWNYLPKKTIGAIVGTVLAITGYQFAIDTQDHVTVSEAQALKAAGVEQAIVGLSYWSPCSQAPKINPNAETAIRSFREAGVPVSGYLLVSPHQGGAEVVDYVKSRIATDAWDLLDWVAVDFEVPGECYPQFAVPYQTIVDSTARLRELGKCVEWTDGCRSVLYTSCGEWTSRLDNGNRPKPPMTVLWNASWDGNPDIDYARCQFGGYTPDEVFIEQYSGGTTIAGVHLDPNTLVVRDLPKPTPTPTPTPPVITPPDCGCECDYSREEVLWALTAAGFIEGMEAFGGTSHTLHPYDQAILACIAE